LSALNICRESRVREEARIESVGEREPGQISSPLHLHKGMNPLKYEAVEFCRSSVTVRRIRRASIFRVEEQYKQAVSRAYLATCFTVVSCLAFSLTLKIETIYSSETSVYFQQSI
jgi:hypothetical protein